MVEEAQALGELAPGVGELDEHASLGIPGTAGLPPVGRGRRDVETGCELFVGESTQRSTVDLHLVSPGGQVCQGQHVAVQLVGDRDEPKLQGAEETEVDRQTIVEPIKLELAAVGIDPPGKVGDATAGGRNHGGFARVDGDRRDLGGGIQALQDRIRHRELSELGQVNAVGGVQRGLILGLGAGIDGDDLALNCAPWCARRRWSARPGTEPAPSLRRT